MVEVSPGLSFEERTSDYNNISGLAESCDPEQTLEIFRRAAFIRHFEFNVKKAKEDGHVAGPVYLSVGHEWPAAVASVMVPGAWVTYQHRCHNYFLAFGGDPARLIDELLGLETGSNRGMGGSNCLQDIDRKLIGHNGLIGDNVPVACGIALAKKEPSVCFFGDGAAEEDYVMGALGFAATHQLPILFICDDNDLSVLTPIKDRRTWKVDDLAKGLGIPAVDITDDPWLIRHHIEQFQCGQKPALINVRTCRELWHQGTGCDGAPEWNRWHLVKEQLAKLDLGARAERIEQEEKERVESLWQQRLQTRSAN